MHLLCPDCRNPFSIDDSAWPRSTAVTCPAGHEFAVRDGVLELLDAPLAQRLAGFLAPFSAIRASDDRRLTDPAIYPLLPAGPAVHGQFEWRLRRYDLQVITALLDRPGSLRTLDIGAWNGWLSNRLATLGHRVTAVDYFVDQYDGLGARRFYSNDWRAVQMNLEDLEVLDEQFDVVIVNRCLQFYADPVAYARAAQAKVAASGFMVLTGLAFVRDPAERIAGMAAQQKRLRENGLDFFKPMKGYLDFEDKSRLEAQHYDLRPYRQLLAANARSLLSPTAPRYYYAVWQAGHATA